MSKTDRVLEGKYFYYANGQKYTEENFHVERETTRDKGYHFHSEVLTRVKTGEFLKIYIDYHVTHKFDPVQVQITRQLGEKESCETFHVDDKTKNYTYTFESSSMPKNKYFEKIITHLPQIATPCFLTSLIMVNQKKLDPVQRTPYTILTSNNIWEYHGEFQEKEMYVELQDLKPTEITINDIKLKATHAKLLAVDENGTISKTGQDIYLSKFYNIPYKGVFENNIEISIAQLKDLDKDLN